MFFPAYNEEESVVELVRNAESVLKEVAGKYEIIIVVYEGSTDGTIGIVKGLSKKDKRIRLVIQPLREKGVGWAIKMGFDAAKYEYIFYTDSDNQFDLREFKRFLPYIEDYGVIAGYRINRQDPFLRIVTSKIYNFIIRSVFGAKERDVDCAFRLVNKKVVDKVSLVCMLGLGTTELLVKARKFGFRIKEIGVHHFPRRKGSSVFESKGVSLPRVGVVLDLLREMKRLWKDLHR
jgi:glycosyltransferase involved in cell wall biosynthesis|tara:strand:- start:583 stop:1284 length:702 start_codon:yes stop_codon:yes gene_type:complete